MNPNPTPADIEDILLEILRENRPGTSVPGCDTTFDAYKLGIQKRILEPLLQARHEAGLIEPLDDLGHRLPFVDAWNRALLGQSQDWDCRVLADPIVTSATKRSFLDFRAMMKSLFSENMDQIDSSLLKNLPDILAGDGFRVPISGAGLKSWVTADNVWIRMERFQVFLCEKDGTSLQSPPNFKAFMQNDIKEETQYIALMGFWGTGVNHKDSEDAFTAWQKQTRRDLMKFSYQTKVELMERSLVSYRNFGIHNLTLLSDQSVSVEQRDDGFLLYRGKIDGLPRLTNDGYMLCGPKDRFLQVLTEGGFEISRMETWLEAMVHSGAAFEMKVPAGSIEKVLIDPELLYEFDNPDPDPWNIIRPTSKEDAVVIFAAGTFPMPEMRSWQDICAEKAKQISEGSDPEP